MGSGTTAVEAQLAARPVFGVELDPYARLVSDVRVRRYSASKIADIGKTFRDISAAMYTQTVDENLVPKLENIRYWFDEGQFEDLLRLKSAIHERTEEATLERDFFNLVLADLIRPCSKAERQTLKPYISKKYIKVPAEVLPTFHKTFTAYFGSINEFEDVAPNDRTGRIDWIGTDARNFETSDVSIDLAITSPPYINALDYVRCIKLESSWVGTGTDESLNLLKKSHLGENISDQFEEPEALESHSDQLTRIGVVDKRRLKIVRSYFSDMAANLRSVHRAMKHGGMYYLIVGDSVIRGVPVETHKWIAEIAESQGYRWSSYFKYRIKDHRTSIPRQGNGGKIDYEHVIGLQVS